MLLHSQNEKKLVLDSSGSSENVTITAAASAEDSRETPAQVTNQLIGSAFGLLLIL